MLPFLLNIIQIIQSGLNDSTVQCTGNLNLEFQGQQRVSSGAADIEIIVRNV